MVVFNLDKIVLSGGFSLCDSEAGQRALQFLYIYSSNVNSYSSTSESCSFSHPRENGERKEGNEIIRNF